jgi:choline monooxygenase
VLVDTWGPFVFVNPDLDGAPLAETLGDVPAVVAETGFDLGALEYDGRWDWSIQANWKVSIENYLECYHCPVAHPSFSELLDVDPDGYHLSTGRWTSSQRTHVRASVLAGEHRAAYDPRGGSTEAQYHLVWPNFTINIEAGVANVGVDVWCPDGPDRTVGFSERWFAPDVPRALRDEMVAFARQVGFEDNSLCESVHRGLASGMVPRGRLMRESEPLIAHFQRLVLDALGG